MSYYRRHLPHWQPEGEVLFVTWRLQGSLPQLILQQLRTRKDAGSGEAFREFDRRLDRAAFGPLWLKEPKIAEAVVASLLRGQALGHYRLGAYVVMANHVHVLLEPHVPLARITRAIKGTTAREDNKVLGRTGLPFWQDESFDHWARNANQCNRMQHYIENNPVKAGLVSHPQDWPWSSASHGLSTVPERSCRTGKSACPTNT